MFRKLGAALFAIILFASCTSQQERKEEDTDLELSNLKVSEDGRYFMTEKGDPFFWLGDTGWLLFSKLNREESEQYLENRRQKGFNVIQVMVLHGVGAVNAYGDSALVNKDVARPNVTEGNSFEDSLQYDFWDHVDFIVDRAAEKGIYMALVPVWGSNVKAGFVNQVQGATYAEWLAERYKGKTNIIWLNGGDIRGNDSIEVWRKIGHTLRKKDPNHLITFHPRGRTQSSMWFHNEPWLDFNMFQSGHRRYDQDTSANELHFGEDNWKYIAVDYKKEPAKPTLDGEPSYEKIPQGLHDTLQPVWTDSDVRRYGYWSVFSGGSGYTYGHNAVMQMHKPTDTGSAYGAKDYWNDAINDPGAGQMVYLKELMLSRPYFERIPDQTLIAEQGSQYGYQVATRGKDYAFIYTYNGSNIKVHMGKISGEEVKVSWFDPRTGNMAEIGAYPNKGVAEFDPPGEEQDGNDWVLVLDKI